MKFQQVNVPRIMSFCLILLFLGLMSASVTHAETYTFVTKWGYEGSGNGQYYYPYGVAVDPSGNVYVADSGNHRIQKFTSTGGYLTQWGSYGSGDGQFSYPSSIAVDSSGNVYVADRDNHRIQKFTSTGGYLSKWGSSGSGNGQFSYPCSVAVDPSGNVYVADINNHRIQKFTSTGGYLTQWGSSGSGDGQFSYPYGVAVDSSGNVYVADINNHRIQKFTSTGGYLTQWGSSGSDDGQFQYPEGVAVDSSGNVYVADRINHRIQKFNSTGGYLSKWGSEGSGDGQFEFPKDVAVDSSGNVYVADTHNNRIQKFIASDISGVLEADFTSAPTSGNAPLTVQFTDNSTGSVYSYAWDFYNDSVVENTTKNPSWVYSAPGTYTVKLTVKGPMGSNSMVKTGYITVLPVGSVTHENYTFITKWGSYGSGDGQFVGPVGVTVDSSGTVYVADRNNHRIQKFTSTGGYFPKWGSEGSGNGQFEFPNDVAVDSSGNVYVVDEGNNRIQKFNSTGGYLTQWGSYGSGNGQLNSPECIVVDSSDDVYVTDTDNHRIQKFNSTGGYLNQWGSYGSGGGQFVGPAGVAVDSLSNVYVADSFNHRIQKFTSTGGYLTQWGSYGSGNGQFSYPSSIAVDSSGKVYVADSDNHRIQKFTSTGGYLTQWGSSGSGDGQFSYPYGVAVDSSGNVYVADNNNHRIQKFIASDIDFTAFPTSGNAPLTVQFTDNSTGTVDSYAWDFNNDGVVDNTTMNPSYTYSAPGTYTVNLTVKRPGGSNSIVKDGYIVVNEPISTAPIADFTENMTSGITPLTVKFNASTSQNADSYAWDFGDKNTGTGQIVEHTFANAGTFKVNLTVENKNGTSVAGPHIITAVAPSVPDIPEPSSNIEAQDVAYTFASAGSSTNVNFPANNTSVLNLSFIANSDIGNIVLVVDSLKGQSSLTSGSPSGSVYQFLDIWVMNSSGANVENLTNDTIGFKVAKSWIQSNNINQSSITLNRYSNGVWSQLPTVLVDDDGTYLYFIAQTPDFSPFAITGNTESVLTTPISLTRTANPMTYKYVGQKITYTYTVTNSGTVSLKNIKVSDNKIGLIISGSTLAPGRSVKGTGIYTITQADLTAGSVTTSATATGTSGSKKFTSAPAIVTVTAVQNPVLKLTKTTIPLTYTYVGQKIKYTYIVTNSGNVPISNIMVTDDKVCVAISSGTLAPGRSVVGTGTYTITQTDIDAGSVSGIASATGAFNGQAVNSNQVTSKVHLQEPWAFFSAKPTFGRAPLTVQFADKSKFNPTQWEWNFGDGNTSTKQNPSHEYKNPGRYTVTLFVKNAGGSDSDTIKNYIVVTKK